MADLWLPGDGNEKKQEAEWLETIGTYREAKNQPQAKGLLQS